jgi:hypothetical protein
MNFPCVLQPKRKLAGIGYTGESGLLGVAYAGESGLTGVAYTENSTTNFSHKNSPA